MIKRIFKNTFLGTLSLMTFLSMDTAFSADGSFFEEKEMSTSLNLNHTPEEKLKAFSNHMLHGNSDYSLLEFTDNFWGSSPFIDSLYAYFYKDPVNPPPMTLDLVLLNIVYYAEALEPMPTSVVEAIEACLITVEPPVYNLCLGLMYRERVGYKDDILIARDLLTYSAEAGLPAGQRELAILLSNTDPDAEGMRWLRDIERAHTFYEKAVAQGDRVAKGYLAFFYQYYASSFFNTYVSERELFGCGAPSLNDQAFKGPVIRQTLEQQMREKSKSLYKELEEHGNVSVVPKYSEEMSWLLSLGINLRPYLDKELENREEVLKTLTQLAIAGDELARWVMVYLLCNQVDSEDYNRSPPLIAETSALKTPFSYRKFTQCFEGEFSELLRKKHLFITIFYPPTPETAAKVLDLLQPLVKQKDEAALVYVVGLYLYGHESVRNPQKALDLLNEFVETTPHQIFIKKILAYAYEQGGEEIQDKEKAIALRENLILQGDQKSVASLKALLKKEGETRLASILERAQADYPFLTVELAALHMGGGAAVRNHEKAANLLEPLAKKGYAGAVYHLYYLYLYGDETVRSLDKAHEFITNICQDFPFYTPLHLLTSTTRMWCTIKGEKTGNSFRTYITPKRSSKPLAFPWQNLTIEALISGAPEDIRELVSFYYSHTLRQHMSLFGIRVTEIDSNALKEGLQELLTIQKLIMETPEDKRHLVPGYHQLAFLAAVETNSSAIQH